MDPTTLGITILDGSTRIRSNGQLIRLEDLASTPGPPGPQGEQGIQGIQGPAGEDGQDGTVDTTNYYNKQQTDFLLMMNTPSISTYPGEGIRVWDDQQDLMRNLVGQNGVSVSLHGDGDCAIIDGSGSGGIDPTYMTLANDEITMHKNVVAGAVGATSLAIGAGGSIMCFGNITAAFGGIIYANSGLECSTMLCQGIRTSIL